MPIMGSRRLEELLLLAPRALLSANLDRARELSMRSTASSGSPLPGYQRDINFNRRTVNSLRMNATPQFFCLYLGIHKVLMSRAKGTKYNES